MINEIYIERAKKERESWPEWKRNCGSCDPAYCRILRSLGSHSDDSEHRP